MIRTQRRTTNRATITLLTVAMLGFGVIADAHVAKPNATATSQTSGVIAAPLKAQVLTDLLRHF